MNLQDERRLGTDNLETSKLRMEAGVAGLIATVAATAVLYGVGLVGLPVIDVPRLLGHGMAGYGLSGGGGLIAGWLGWFASGSMLGTLYGWIVARKYPTRSTLGALGFALLPWLFLQLVVYPLLGLGAFARRDPAWRGGLLTTLLGFAAYGLCLGALLDRWLRATALPRVRLAA